MPPKKGKGNGKAKKSEGDNDTKAEQKRIIDEIYNAPDIGDYPMNLEMAQKLVETENIEFLVLVQRMQDINRRLESDTQNLQQVKDVEDSKIEGERQTVDQMRKRNTKARADLRNQKKDCQDAKEEAVNTAKNQRSEYEIRMEELRSKYEPKLEAQRKKIAELEAVKADLEDFKDREFESLAELKQWEDNVSQQQAMHKNLIEGIERDRIKQIDKLRKDMLMQIRQVRMKNSVTNEDQLQGTTKLTVIQNMQLTAELDYQSKRTEDLMFKNHEMKSVITNLTKDLEDHKEVEKELAKRSHFCQKVIQKYKQQITDLQDEIKQNDFKLKQETKRQAEDTEQQDLMNYLNQRIQQIEIKLNTTQNHLNLQEEEYQSLLDKMITIRNRYSKVILLLTEFIESFVEKDPSILQRQNDIFLDIDAVKDAEDLHEVEPETLVALGLVLLKQLQPYVQDLSDLRHQENYMKKAHGSPNVIHEIENLMPSASGLQELEQRPVHLKMREDEQKLSFSKKIGATANTSNYISAAAHYSQPEEDRGSQPTRGNTHGMNSNLDAHGYEQSSAVRSSLRSNVKNSEAFNSGLHNYGSTGVDSGMSRREAAYQYVDSDSKQFALPGVSRLPQVDMKQNFMHLRTNNRSGMHSLDRSRGGGAPMQGRRGPLPNTHSSNRKDPRLNYNSSSIPYLNKRGAGPDSGLTAQMPAGSMELGRRPNNYAPVGLGGTMGKSSRPSGLPSVI